MREFAPHALGDFFTAEHNAPEIFEAHLLPHGLVQHVINKGRHADQDVGFDFVDQPEVPIGSHDFAAARAGGENSERRAAIVRLPERQMRRVGKQVRQSHRALRSADFKEPFARQPQIVQIVLREQKRNRVRGPPGRAGHENRPKLGLKTVLHSLTTLAQRAALFDP